MMHLGDHAIIDVECYEDALRALRGADASFFLAGRLSLPFFNLKIVVDTQSINIHYHSLTLFLTVFLTVINIYFSQFLFLSFSHNKNQTSNYIHDRVFVSRKFKTPIKGKGARKK